jgi:hypothetical protein
MSASSAFHILETGNMRRIAKRLYEEERLGTLADLGALSDARIDGLLWMTNAQREKLKDLCAACRQGDPDLARAIGDPRYAEAAGGKMLEIDADIAGLGVNLVPGLAGAHVVKMAHMRGLLGEMGRLSAQAPTKLQGLGVVDGAKAIAGGARYLWNYGTFMSAGFVTDRLKEVLAVCGTRLDLSPEALAQERARVRGLNGDVIEPSLKKKMTRLERALRT